MTSRPIGIHAFPASFPEQIWLGSTTGQWPIQAFVSEAHAAVWASETDPERRTRYVVGPMVVPHDLPLLRGKKIPAQNTLELVDKPSSDPGGLADAGDFDD